MNEMILGFADIAVIFGIILGLLGLIIPLTIKASDKNYQKFSSRLKVYELSQSKQERELNYLKEGITEMASLLVKSNAYSLQLISSITRQIDISTECPNQNKQTKLLNQELIKLLLEFQLIENDPSIRRSALHMLKHGYADDSTDSLIERAKQVRDMVST